MLNPSYFHFNHSEWLDGYTNTLAWKYWKVWWKTACSNTSLIENAMRDCLWDQGSLDKTTVVLKDNTQAGGKREHFIISCCPLTASPACWCSLDINPQLTVHLSQAKVGGGFYTLHTFFGVSETVWAPFLLHLKQPLSFKINKRELNQKVCGVRHFLSK